MWIRWRIAVICFAPRKSPYDKQLNETFDFCENNAVINLLIDTRYDETQKRKNSFVRSAISRFVKKVKWALFS